RCQVIEAPGIVAEEFALPGRAHPGGQIIERLDPAGICAVRRENRRPITAKNHAVLTKSGDSDHSIGGHYASRFSSLVRAFQLTPAAGAVVRNDLLEHGGEGARIDLFALPNPHGTGGLV